MVDDFTASTDALEAEYAANNRQFVAELSDLVARTLGDQKDFGDSPIAGIDWNVCAANHSDAYDALVKGTIYEKMLEGGISQQDTFITVATNLVWLLFPSRPGHFLTILCDRKNRDYALRVAEAWETKHPADKVILDYDPERAR